MSKKIEWTDFVEKVSSYTGIEINELSKETNIYEDLGFDSLGLFSLGLFLNKSYDISIPLSAVATIETIGDIFITLNEHKSEE